MFVSFDYDAVDCKTIHIFSNIQVRASSQTKGLERGWNKVSETGDLSYIKPVFRKEPTVMHSNNAVNH